MFSQLSPPSAQRPNAYSVDAGAIRRWRLFAISMLVLGAATIEALLATPQISTREPALVHGCVALLLGLAVALGRARQLDAPHLALSRLVIVATTVTISVIIAVGDGVQAVPVFYVWPLLGSSFLLARSEVIGGVVATAALYAVALVESDPPGGFPGFDFGLTLAALVVVVVIVRVLAESFGTTIDSLRLTSSTDPLTGLLNRRSFTRHFGRQFERAVHDDRPITAMLIDIDHFKAVNDRFGHAVGDQALVRFTELLTSSCRASDLVARVGGEEFAVVMPGATLEQAVARAEQFCSTLRGDRAVDGVSLTASVGIALRTGATDSCDAMLLVADEAVYEAKRNGRDRIVVAGEGEVAPRDAPRSAAL